MKMLKYCVISVLLVASVLGEEGPIIPTPSGLLQGELLSCGLFCNYYSFKGIPYAEPPIGALRFRSPVPHPGWEGVRQATQHGNICPQLAGTVVFGNEDCLFLNVYTQDLIGQRPVMVYIHGGGFTDGSGNSGTVGPDFIVQEGVVLVSINYRLGILGYLGTGDRHAQGNYGMKDMVQALRWIRDNISAFGGDPNTVTIFGDSAGGAAIHYLVLSSMANGLFHHAIAHSGSALNPWTFQPNPNARAFALASRLGITATTSEALVAAIREMPINQLVLQTPDWPAPRGFRPFEFAVTAEPEDSEEPRFLTNHPYNLISSGAFNRVPLLMGYNNMECLLLINDEPMFDDTNPDNFVPVLWNVPEGSPAATEIANSFRNLYWNGGPLSQNLRLELSNYQTDHLFAYGVDKSIRMHAAIQQENVYYYMFTFDGDLNGAKISSNLQQYAGAMHTDEIFYLFNVSDLPLPTEITPTNPAYAARSRMVRLWTNFAKFGNPTPVLDDLVTVNWPAVSGSQEYLNIGAELLPGTNPSSSRMNVWYDLETRFSNNL